MLPCQGRVRDAREACEVYFSNREKSKVKNECLYYVVIDNISFID